jgi:hypothetical protein
VGHPGAEPGPHPTDAEEPAVVHHHDPMDAVRRTVSRATRPALAPLRAAAATLQSPDAATLRSPDAATLRSPDAATADPADDARPTPLGSEELEELAAMRDELAATPDLRVPEPADRAARATRSASAYLEARRARLRRELRELDARR